jgi:hypothetical protein
VPVGLVERGCLTGCSSVTGGCGLIGGRLVGAGVPPDPFGRLEGGGGVGSFLGCGAVVVGFAGGEELDVARDDFELLAPPVVGVPFGVVQAALDGDLAALGEVLSDGVGLASKDGDVDVVSALVFAVLAGPLDGEPQAGDRSVGGGPQFRVGGEAAGEGDYLELRRRGFCDGVGSHVDAFRERLRADSFGGTARRRRWWAAGAGRWSEGGDLLGGVWGVVGGLVGLAAEMDASLDGVLGAAGTVLGEPFAVDQAAGDGDRAAFGELTRAGFGLVAERGDVDDHGGWSFWSLTAIRMSQTVRFSSSFFRTGSAVRFSTKVTELTAGVELLIWFPPCGDPRG